MNPRVPERWAVGIVGGGPAGAALAMRLCRLGHRVLIVADRRGRHGIQGFSDRTLACLRAIGADRALATVGPRFPRLVQWNGIDASPNDEHLVHRPVFDAALLRDAEAVGATVLTGKAGIPQASDSGLLPVRCAQGTATVAADLWIDARGRAVAAAGNLRASGPTTLAILQAFQTRAVPSRPFSTVLSLPDGWCWVAVRTDGTGVVQRVVEGGRGRVSGIRARNLVAELGRLRPEWHSSLATARDAGPLLACPAGATLHSRDGIICIGDASMAPDPLSGHGVHEALSESRHAAAAVNTCLRTPHHAALAHRFIQQRTRERFTRLQAAGARAYALETRWPEAPFWSVRRHTPAPAETHSGPPLVVHEAPVFERDLIVPASIVITARHPRGVWRVHDVPVAPLLARLQAGVDLDAAARLLDVPCDRAAQARRWLYDEGLLAHGSI